MSSATTTQARRPLNGVDVPTLFATIDAVKAQPEAARFQFRAVNRWISGTHSRTTIHGFFGVGQQLQHKAEHTYDADHPEVLVGTDQAPSPVEFILHGLAACLTAGIGNIAAARGIELTEVESRVEGDIDLRGLLGLSDEIRNGYEQIRVSFRIAGDATEEQLRAVVEQSRARSAVFDIVTNGVPVDVSVETA
ncbi:MAG: OsmC family protein [Actinobacteria bacterium]|nr:OsmC family protein [Actinomycetota bacterium]